MLNSFFMLKNLYFDEKVSNCRFDLLMKNRDKRKFDTAIIQEYVKW